MFFLAVIGLIFGLECGVKKHMDRVRAIDEQRLAANGKIILKKYYNTGAAGNFLSNYPKAMRCIHAAALGGVAAELLRLLGRRDAGIAKLGLSFLAGGGLSNLYDRIRKGYVVDYVSFAFGPDRFRKLVFNIADFFVFAGALLVALAVVRR